MHYRIEVTKSAERDLRDLPTDVAKRVVARIASLAENPCPNGVKKLAGMDDLYRIRVGDYRIIYEIRDAAILITVVRVRHRGTAYR